MSARVTVALPVLDGGPLLARVVNAICAQEVDRDIELVVADSGSTDGSRFIAEGADAHLIEIPPGEFSHGATRNLLVSESTGDHIAFLTQDSLPANEHWLARLLGGFELADDVGLVFGPYRPRDDASPMVRRELESWFGSFSPDGTTRVDRTAGPDADARRAAFFTDANGAIARRAWEQAPFREVPYAEDQMIARDMLAAGWAKAYVPAAEVVHSHEYGLGDLLKRGFDEWRGLREVAGLRAHSHVLGAPLTVQRAVRDDLALVADEGLRERFALLRRSAAHHGARELGAVLGSRADRVPRRLRGRLSLERRDGFDPVDGEDRS